MIKMKPNYKSAVITFPFFERDLERERLEEVGWEMEGRDTLRFLESGYVYQVNINERGRHGPRTRTPLGRRVDREYQEKIAIPMKELVVNELSGCDDLFNEMFDLVQAGNHDPHLCYFRGKNGSWFRVYDYMKPHKGQLLSKVLELREASDFAQRFPELQEAAAHVNREESWMTPYVEGRTFKEALERALTIYRRADKLLEA